MRNKTIDIYVIRHCLKACLLLIVFQLVYGVEEAKAQAATNVRGKKKINHTFIFKGETLIADVVVAKDSSGDFTTVSDALNFLTNASVHRVIIYVRDGVYTEKVTINRPNVTMIGQSRKGTRIEYSIAAGLEGPSRGVFNIFGNGVILQNLTVANTYPQRRHTFALYGRGSYVVTIGCDFIANGNDTVAMWAISGGYYYHADCHFEGNIDYLCPRGWCYVTNSTFHEVDTRTNLWHDGDKDPNKKLVIQNSTFTSARKSALARYPRDAQFYLIGCRFSDSTTNVLDNNAPDTLNDEFRYGRRAYFYDCHKDGGDEAWHANNLSTAAGSPKPSDINARWTFDGHWDPESKAPPTIVEIKYGLQYRTVQVVFSEPVTVRGLPVLKTAKGKTLSWTAINGTNTITFTPIDKDDSPATIEIQEGAIFASAAGTTTRNADLKLPRIQRKTR